ncbi:MAG: hypothetical protein ACE5F8_04265 [Woeseiaceae bacterium]
MFQLAIVATLLFGDASVAGSKKDKEACEKVKAQIEKIVSRMRHGYSAAQGVRYEEKLRELREKRFKICR